MLWQAKNISFGSNEFPNLNLRQIVNGFLSYDRTCKTDRQTQRQTEISYFINIDKLGNPALFEVQENFSNLIKFPWVFQATQSTFEANRPRGLGVMIDGTSKQTNRNHYFIFIY